MNGIYVEEVYRRCIKQERDRERQWRKSKRKGDIRNAVHLVDFEKAEFMEKSPPWLSDGGKGAADIIAACDACHELSHHWMQRELAREKVKRIDARLLPVFDLILENGNNRKESIWRLTSQILASKKRRSGRPRKCATGGTSKN